MIFIIFFSISSIEFGDKNIKSLIPQFSCMTLQDKLLNPSNSNVFKIQFPTSLKNKLNSFAISFLLEIRLSLLFLKLLIGLSLEDELVTSLTKNQTFLSLL